MIGLAKGKPPYEIVEGVNEGELNSFSDWVQFCMLYSACELHPFLMPACKKPKARGPPCPSFQKNYEMEDTWMSEWIRIRVKDFYKDAIGETEYTYVTKEVYEALTETFRKEAHAQEMRDLRHVTKEGYTEGETEDLAFDSGESLEDMVIRQMEMETLQKAMQSLTEVQRERLHLYFFEGLTYRQIAEKKGIGEKNVRESITSAIKKIKKFFD